MSWNPPRSIPRRPPMGEDDIMAMLVQAAATVYPSLVDKSDDPLRESMCIAVGLMEHALAAMREILEGKTQEKEGA